jgi:hypothetical protein
MGATRASMGRSYFKNVTIPSNFHTKSTIKMSYFKSKLQVPIFWIEYFKYTKVLTPNQRNKP